jgi:hypothetical protein
LRIRFFVVLAIGLMFSVLAYGESQPPLDRPAELEDVPEPPEIPPRVQSGETLEPDVRIIHGEKQTIREYSVNGQVYAIRVEPDIGPGYWLVDSNGDGLLDSRRNNFVPSLAIPSIVIFSW